MGIRLNVYESIVNGIKRDIGLGFLREGDKLPSCREMALKLGVNPNTVQRAYSELESAGIIYTVPKKGVYVCGKDGGDAATLAIKALKEAGATKEQLLKIIDGLFGEDCDD